MEKLIRLRGKLKQFYAVYSTYILMLAKFAVAMALFLTINRYFPGRAFLLRTIVVIAFALFCSVLPWGLVSFFSAVWLLAQASARSPGGAIFLLVLLLVLAVVRYVLLPGSGMAVPLMPLLYLWGIPYAVPAVVGLSGGITGFISVGSGLVFYHVLNFMAKNSAYLADRESSTLVQKMLFLLEGLLKNQRLLIGLVCFCLTTLLIWLISRLELAYARTIALAVGLILNAVMIGAACTVFGLSFSVLNLIAGTLAAFVIGMGYNIFGRFLNYGKTEKVQFEDDDYYYYVKAVPKVTLPGDEANEDQKALQDEQLQAFLEMVERLNDDKSDDTQEDV